MSGKSSISRALLLDTNAAIALLDGDKAIEALLDQVDATYIPSIALGELFFGAEKSTRMEANRARVEAFVRRRTVLVCDAETARWYGRISNQLRLKGRPIPQNDKWIAAIAQQHGLTLLTRDEHFKHINGLSAETW